MVNRRKGGLLYTEHLSITAIRDADGACLHYVAVFSDITQRKQSEERLHFLANHDALTGLPNRTLFLERLQEAIERAQPARSQFALLFVDLTVSSWSTIPWGIMPVTNCWCASPRCC